MSNYDDYISREPDWHTPGPRPSRGESFDDREEYSVCDIADCTEPVRVTIQGLGQFCSRAHADLGAAQHERAMTRKVG